MSWSLSFSNWNEKAPNLVFLLPSWNTFILPQTNYSFPGLFLYCSHGKSSIEIKLLSFPGILFTYLYQLVIVMKQTSQILCLKYQVAVYYFSQVCSSTRQCCCSGVGLLMCPWGAGTLAGGLGLIWRNTAILYMFLTSLMSIIF